jgi:1-deoxy-D-xylulose-5-phosphate synthase
MVATAAALDDGPCALRYPRGEGLGVPLPAAGAPLEIGRGRMVREGSDIALLSLGGRLAECLKAADELEAAGLSVSVADARFAKPLDSDLVLRLAREHACLITIEEGAIGGFAAQVMTLLADHGAFDHGLRLRSMTLPDRFLDHDAPAAMYAAAGLDSRAIVQKALLAMGPHKAVPDFRRRPTLSRTA